MSGEVFLHVPAAVRDGFERKPNRNFYKRLYNEFTKRGVRVKLAPYEQSSHRKIEEDDGNLHIVQNGAVRKRNVLNTTIAYLDNWYQLDARGVLSQSSIGQENYDPKSVNRKRAWAFFTKLRATYVDARFSRYSQPLEKAEDLPKGAISVFLQGASHITDRSRKCSTPDMIRSVAKGSGGRPIVVKPHPLKVGSEDVLTVHDLARSGVNIQLSDANVHDILARSEVTVSISSACCFEGFLHRRPAVLFGHSDFHHMAESLNDLDDFAGALERAKLRGRGYSNYVYWFLKGRCLSAHERGFWKQVEKRIDATGFVFPST